VLKEFPLKDMLELSLPSSNYNLSNHAINLVGVLMAAPDYEMT
jgi:hypothetical protein